MIDFNKNKKELEMKTFVVAGIDPKAAAIFAVEGMTSLQKESFGKEKAMYLIVSYDPKAMDITDRLDKATLFTEDEAYQFKATLNNNKSRIFDTFTVYDIADLKSGLVTVSPEPAIER
jgi:hypothetical protein